jgi:hypothetical protein
MFRHVSALTDDHLQGPRKFLACAAYGSNYMVGILHMIEINIVEFKCYSS